MTRFLLGLAVLAGLSSTACAAPWVGVHRGTRTGEAIHWESRFGLSPPQRTVALAVPLPADTEVVGGTPGLRAVHDEQGRIVSLEVPGRTEVVEVSLRQTWPGGVSQLAAPLATGNAVQRVVVEEARVVPTTSTGLQKHIRYWSPPGLDRKTRRRVDRFADGRSARGREQPIYLVADARLQEAGGLTGQLADARRITAGFPVFVGSAFAGFLGLCVWGFRRLEAEARAEKNALYIERLGQSGDEGQRSGS